MKTNGQVIIIGGGLSGLTLAYLLQQRHIPATVLEASPRLGGRIQTVAGTLSTPLELGATWFSDIHTHLLSLITELRLEKFPQFSKGISLFQTKSFEPPQKFFLPESESPSYRIAGGTQAIIHALAQNLKANSIKLNTKVTGIREVSDGLAIETGSAETLNADMVISCLPPQLAASQIKFMPGLPQSISNILPTVQTWMAGAIKFTLEYAEPFWREKGFSGMLCSHAGIIMEMYDHTNFEGNLFGFTGFLNGESATFTQEVRKELVLHRLNELMGDEALRPTAYFDKVWKDEYVLEGNPVIMRPHQNNGHPALQLPYMNGKFFFCGTETAAEYAGYMEGAVIAAKKMAERLV